MVEFILPFVNNGEPFEFKNWTPKKHETALVLLRKYTKTLEKTDKEGNVKNHNEVDKVADDYFKYFVILVALQDVDSNITIDTHLDIITNLHPENTVILFNGAYGAGKLDVIYREDFQKPPMEKRSKSIGKKS